jgi:hypothetical protein
VISLNLVLAGLRLGLKNRQVGEKWVFDDCSYSKSVSVAAYLSCDALVVNYSMGKSVSGVVHTNGTYL